MDVVVAMKRGSVIACILWAIAAACGSCSGDDGSTGTSDGGPDVRVTIRDAGTMDNLDAEVPDAASFSANGWPQLTGFDPSCAMYVAPSPDKFPPPNAWEPCDSRVHGADGGTISCQQIADNWGSGVTAGSTLIQYVSSAYVDQATQAVTLPIIRSSQQGYFFVVGDADGPIRQAVLAPSQQCVLGLFASVSKSNVIYEIDEMSSDLQSIVKSGAVGGPFGSPRVLRMYNNIDSLGYTGGANEFAEIGAAGFDTGSWEDGHKLDTLGTTAPGQVGELQFQQDDLFFTVTDLNDGRIQHYTADSGVTDFISFGSDTQSYAADFGTDGTDMVWTEAFGHDGGDADSWATINTVTSSYTTNAGSVAKRRLDSQSTYGLGTTQFVVGCGYAAHRISDADGGGARVIRLSDGRSWNLVTTGPDPLAWLAPVAVSCTEVFVNFNFGSSTQNLARIRLDSLGSGDPAD